MREEKNWVWGCILELVKLGIFTFYSRADYISYTLVKAHLKRELLYSVLSCVQLFVIHGLYVAYEIPLSMEFSRQEYSRGSSQPRDQTSISCIDRQILYHCTTWDAPAKGNCDANLNLSWTFSSVQFSRSVVSDSLRHHEPQHTRSPCPSPTPGVHPNSCPLSRWCHPTI